MTTTTDLVTKSYKIISDLIYRYELPPGFPLSDFALSKRIGISRTPIRQAILKLVADGIVERKDSGFCVVGITENFITELYEARCAIEFASITLIFDKKLPVEHIRNCCAREESYLKEGRFIEALDMDIAFHHEIVKAAGNNLLERAYTIIHNRMKLINLLSLVSMNFNTPQIYADIIDSFKEGDVGKTWAMLKKQNENGQRQKIVALKKFGGLGQSNLFNFIAGCFVAFNNRVE